MKSKMNLYQDRCFLQTQCTTNKDCPAGQCCFWMHFYYTFVTFIIYYFYFFLTFKNYIQFILF